MAWGGHARNRRKRWRGGISRRGAHLVRHHNSYKAVAGPDVGTAHNMGLSGQREWGWKDTILSMQKARAGREECCPKCVCIAV